MTVPSTIGATGEDGVKPHALGIACLFRDSVFYLKEWVEYHLMVGVTRFYLCDHMSNDSPEKTLEPYIQKGIVSLLRCNRDFTSNFENEIHVPFFNAAIAASRNEVEWLACLDSDEFIVAQNDTRDPTILSILKRHEMTGTQKTAVLGINWLLFGTSGVKKMPDEKLILETLTQCSPAGNKDNSTLKMIVRPSFVGGMCSPHSVGKIKGAQRTTGGFSTMNTAFSARHDPSDFVLNHYNTGDEDYFTRIKVPFYTRYIGPGAQREQVISRAVSRAFCEVNDDKGISSRTEFLGSLKKRVFGGIRVCVVIHIGNVDLWPFYRRYIHNLRRAGRRLRLVHNRTR